MEGGFTEGRMFGDGRYRISDSKPLGQGSDAVVYEAIDLQQGIGVAVKAIDRLEVDDDDQRLRQLERELKRRLKIPLERALIRRRADATARAEVAPARPKARLVLPLLEQTTCLRTGPTSSSQPKKPAGSWHSQQRMVGLR